MAEQTLKDIGPVVLIGAGKMGLAMARGWIAGGLPPDRLVLVDPFAGDFAKAFAQEHGVRLLQFADGVLTHVLVLAVKPQNMPTALQQVNATITTVSITPPQQNAAPAPATTPAKPATTPPTR